MTIFTKLAKYRQQDRKSSKTEFQTTDKIVSTFYDYTSMQKSITFIKDSMTETIEVPIYDDSHKENNEIFWLTPVSTSGYSETKDIIFKNAGEGTIIDNDTNGQVVIEISSTSADEGDSGIQKALNNIYTSDTFTFIIKQDLMTYNFRKVA